MSLYKPNATLCPPWVTYRNKIAAMFDADPNVEVGDIEDSDDSGVYKFNITCANPIKQLALKEIIPGEIVMGNVKVRICILLKEGDYSKEIYAAAFEGNPIFEGIVISRNPITKEEFNYCVFQKKVIQFYNDDISDLYANYNGIAADIARSIFNKDNPNVQNMMFSTSINDPACDMCATIEHNGRCEESEDDCCSCCFECESEDSEQ